MRPYILRRLKTDKRIISDLPDKTEMTAFCPLTRRQAALYQQSVNELAERLEAPEVEGIQRRGIILAFLTRFKQICNHPSQWLGDGAYAPADSGKFHRLRELCEEIASKQEKVLVFTQYREVTDPLARYLAIRVWPSRRWFFTAGRRFPSARNWWMPFNAMAARPFLSSRSKPAAPASISPPPRM